MLNLITMTPWEHRDKYTQRNTNGYEIHDTAEAVFDTYIASDVIDWGDGKPLVGELATKPIYAEYLALYHGSEVDNSPLKIGEKGYTIECDSYISSIHTLRNRMKTGLSILYMASYGHNIYTNKDDLDGITIRFLAKREDVYTVYVNAFSEFVPGDLSGIDESLYDRITINGEKITKENIFDLEDCDKIMQMYPEYVAQSKKEYDKRSRPSFHDSYRFDTTLTLPARDFIMDIERKEISDFNWKDENELEESVRNGKCTKLFPGYEVTVHTQSLFYEFITKYPVIFAVREFEDGSMECGQFHLVKNPTLLEMLNDMHNDAAENGYSRAIYAAFDIPYFCNINLYEMDLFNEVEMYVEIDAKNKQLQLYDNGYFGRKRFFDFYREDAKFINDEDD